MGISGGLYRVLLLLHIFTAIAGFGVTILAPAFGAQAKARRGREGVAIAEATYKVTSTYAEWLIYSVPVFGILLVLTSDDAWQFSQTWISMSFLFYIVAIGLVHGLHMPNIKKMNGLMAEMADGPPPGSSGPPPQVAELEARGRKAALVGGVLNLLLVAILVMMIWKPGA